MNGFLLMRALRNLLDPELKTLPLCNGQKHEDKLITVPAKIYIGALPAKTGSQPGYDAPFVLIQTLRGYQDEDNFNRMEVALRLCVWHEDTETRENDLYNLIALCRRAVLRQRAAALAGYYVFTASENGQLAPWARPDEQGLYFNEAYIITHWKMLGIEKKIQRGIALWHTVMAFLYRKRRQELSRLSMWIPPCLWLSARLQCTIYP